jgi:hypothetical protein
MEINSPGLSKLNIPCISIICRVISLVTLDGPFPKLCLAVVLFHQDGNHSAVALLLKAALIQVSDYRLMGTSG